MYTENPGKDICLFCRAALSNLVARHAPSLYVKLTHQTGRGGGAEKAGETAEYFLRCRDEYFGQLGLEQAQWASWLKGKRILEYGPGDILGVALLLYAHGAQAVDCVDRFPLQAMSAANLRVYRALLDALEGAARERGGRAFREPGRPESGFDPRAISCRVTRDGLSGRTAEYDWVISRAVLEHVNRLDETLLDVRRALKPAGISVHQVDLKSHGLDRYRDFDFLSWPEPLYRLMYGAKGFPNRWRVDKYVEAAQQAGLRFRSLSPTGCLDAGHIEKLRPSLAPAFRHLPADQLSWLGFWMVLEPADGIGQAEHRYQTMPTHSWKAK